MGLGGALMVVMGSAIAAKVLTGRDLQIANGIGSVAFNTGLAVAITFGVRFSGRPTIAVVIAATLSIILLVTWLVVSKMVLKPEQAQEAAVDHSYTMADGFKEWFNWVFALAYTGLLSTTSWRSRSWTPRRSAGSSTRESSGPCPVPWSPPAWRTASSR
jgi:hypothetical protein